MNDLEKFIEVYYLKDSGLRLLDRERAIEFVELCRTKNVKLGGFDGFYIRENGLQIESSLSRDYSHESKRDAEVHAIDFLTKLEGSDENLGFEMVFVEIE